MGNLGLQQSLMTALLIVWPLGGILATPSKVDMAYMKKVYTRYKAKYEQGFEEAMVYLDSVQSQALDQCMVEEYVQFLKWSMQAAIDQHKLDLLYHYLQLGDEALENYGHDLGPRQKKLQIDIKALWGSYHFLIGSYHQAIATHNEIIQILNQKESTSQRDEELIARSYQFIATIQKQRGDHQSAISNFWTSLDFIEEVWEKYERLGRIASTYCRIAACYQQIGDHRQAQTYYNRALGSLEAQYSRKMEDQDNQFRLRKSIITIYNAIAQYALEQGAFQEALQHLKQSVSYQMDNDPFRKKTVHLFGDVYAAMDSFSRALHYYEIALKEKKQDYGQKNHYNAYTYRAIGQLYAKRPGHAEAITYYNRAIENLTTKPEVLDSLEEVDWSTIFDERGLINVLNLKAFSLIALYKKTQDKNYLRKAWNSLNSAITLIQETRINYGSEEDKQFLLKECYPIFEKAMVAGHLLGPAYYPDLLEITEKSKAVVLVDQHRERNAFRRANIPDSLLLRESQLKAAIIQIEDEIRQENNSPLIDLEKIKSYYQALASAKKRYAGLITQFEETYGYEPPRSRGRDFLLTTIRQELLERDQTLVEYFVGDEFLFIITVNQRHIKVNRIKLDFPLADWIAKFRSGIYDYHLSPEPTDSLYRQTKKQYLEYGWKLYQTLLLPVQDQLKEKLILIPDGALGYIPFEALLTKPESDHSADFDQLPYLLRQHQISYCYSASLLKAMKDKRYRSSGLLAFAPSFPKLDQPLTPQHLTELRRGLDTLYYNIEEVKAIRKILEDGTLQLGPEANKAFFLEQASRFRVIHIASHGILNDSVPDHSYIAFHRGEDQLPQHNLLVKDLYALRLEAELVALSACETGLGVLKRGEGIISLARGFSYAGAKSILTTLWAVNDASTTQIMRSFYEHLDTGAMKDGAIHWAKLDYLKAQSDPYGAHPFYWASYIAIGDMSPLERSGMDSWPIVLLFMGGGSLFLLLWFRKTLGRGQ